MGSAANDDEVEVISQKEGYSFASTGSFWSGVCRGTRNEEDIVLSITDSIPAGSSLEQKFENDFKTHLKKSNKISRFQMGAVGAGIGGAIGFFASPVVLPGLVVAGIAGSAGGYQWAKVKGQKRLQKHGAGDFKADGPPSVYAAQRPTLRRLRYLVRWGNWQILNYESESLPVVDRVAVLDEVIRAFSPWVQALFLVRARLGANAIEADAEALEIFQHLAPLYQWLSKRVASEITQQACALVDQALVEDSVLTEHLELCRIAFPTILETISIMDRLAPSTLAKFAEDIVVSEVARPMNIQRIQARHHLRNIVGAICRVLQNPNIVQALAKPRTLDQSQHKIADALDDCCDEVHLTPMSTTSRRLSDGTDLIIPPDGVEDEIEGSGFHSCDECSDDGDDESYKHRVAKATASIFTFGRNGAHAMQSGTLRSGTFGERLAVFPQGCSDHQWNCGDASKFSVRAESYLHNRLKLPSGPPLFELVHVDFFKIPTSGPISHPATHKDFYPAHHRSSGDDRFLFIQNWILPPYQAVITSALDPQAPWRLADTPQSRCWERFLTASPEEQKNRFKVIPCVEKGPWLVRRAVPKKPVLVGRQLKFDVQHEQGDYLEISIDVSSGKAEQMATAMVMKALSHLQMDVAVVIEGKEEAELPETVLVCASMSNLDTSRLLCPDGLVDCEL
jgi:hypothetical protein